MRSKGHDEKEKIEQDIIKFEVNLGNIEKVGIAFLVVGYSNYIYAINLEILDAQDRNNTGKTPEEAFLFSQNLVVIGYILLWIVSAQRVYAKELNNTYRGEENDLVEYENIATSYLISIFANVMRLESFNRLNENEIQAKKNERE